MESRYVSVLGEEYKVNTEVLRECDSVLDCADGYCDHSVKEIYVAKFIDDAESLKDLKSYEDKVIRHEIIHAFLSESGLSQSSEWATNEEMVDFFAIQFPKILKVFKTLDII